ncbi:UNVERIFIED_CONTAM: SAG-related sequence SRS22C [Hammondia hammondi]|eukprot:XP_008887539.1 SAG-related sequence SRS22C [Hammondia hammondi]
MKLSLLTLATLALSAQQASALRGVDASKNLQQDSQGAMQIPVCKENVPLNFNITEAGQSAQFRCDATLQHLQPKYNATKPQMYSGATVVTLADLIPNATFETVPTAAEKETRTNPEPSYNLTVPKLPTEKHDLHVICSSNEASDESRGTEAAKACKVIFHIASSAVHPVLAASAVVGLVASLLQFA